MQKGELEDYYKKENFREDFTNISGKRITAYKISELSAINPIDTYIEIYEYKNILSHILKKIRKIKTYKKISNIKYKKLNYNQCLIYLKFIDIF